MAIVLHNVSFNRKTRHVLKTNQSAQANSLNYIPKFAVGKCTPKVITKHLKADKNKNSNLTHITMANLNKNKVKTEINKAKLEILAITEKIKNNKLIKITNDKIFSSYPALAHYIKFHTDSSHVVVLQPATNLKVCLVVLIEAIVETVGIIIGMFISQYVNPSFTYVLLILWAIKITWCIIDMYLTISRPAKWFNYL